MLARFENGYYLEVIINKEELNYDYHIYDEDRCSIDCGWTGYRSMELYYPMNEIDYICEFCDPDYIKGKYEILPYDTMEEYEDYLDYLEDGEGYGNWCLEAQGRDYEFITFYRNKEDAEAAMNLKVNDFKEDYPRCIVNMSNCYCKASQDELFQTWTIYENVPYTTEKANILFKMQRNIDRAYLGIDQYAYELTDTWVAKRYLDDLQTLLDQLKELI